MKTSYTVKFSARYAVWFAVRADDVQGEFDSLLAAEIQATLLNSLL
jgi:hypothetical protein